MFWYLLNVFVIILAWFWPQTALNQGEEVILDKRKKCVCIVATINWIILSGCRGWSVGSDTIQYKVGHFDKTLETSWGNVMLGLYQKYVMHMDVKDPGYRVIEKIFQAFSGSYQLFLVAVAVIFFVPLGVSIYKRSQNPCLSYVLFCALFFSFFAITGQRQTIATAIVVFGGISLIEKRKLLPFLIICILASTIHQSALCFIPFYWISQIKISKPVLLLYWVGIIGMFIYRYQAKAFLLPILGYEQYMGEYEGARAGTFMYLLLLLAAFVTIFSQCFSQKDDPIIRMSINALMLASLFTPMLLMNPSAMRIIQYFSIFLLFLLPELAYVFMEGTSRNLFYGISYSVLIVLLAIKPHTYVFFWQ